ncbi:MAG: DUF6629 family protein [Bacteroidia bacterium]
MCFSATASFSAGAVLSVIGIAALNKVKNESQLFFAGIPLLFALQQISEGTLWLALTYPSLAFLKIFTTHMFIFFAQVIWPVWVPYALYRIEKDRKRKKIHTILVGTGVIVAAYLGYCLWHYPLFASIGCNHIFYLQSYPETFRNIGAVMYIIATIIPCFISTVKRMWLLAIAVLISYILARIFYTEYTVSVWCFFASIISIIIWMILKEHKTSDFPEQLHKA